ncbi:unnamed protein product [Caretta caretta]
MSMPAPQRVRQDLCYCPPGYLSPLPEHAPFHTSRVIRYVFLDGSQNIISAPALSGFETHAPYQDSANIFYQSAAPPDWGVATAYWPPHLQRLPIFVTLSKGQEKQAAACGGPLLSRERLPVFRQLCGEVVQAGANGKERDRCLPGVDGEPNKPADPEAPEMEDGRRGDKDGSLAEPSH